MVGSQYEEFISSVWNRVSIFDPAGMIPMAVAGLKNRRELVDCLMFFGQYCFHNRKYDVARAYYEKLLKLAATDDEKANCLLFLGVIHVGRDDYKSAIRTYRKAFSLKPGKDREVWYLLHSNMGNCLNHVKRHADALEHCRAAAAISRKRPDAHRNMGIALEGLGRYAEAAKAYVAFCRLSPGDEEALRLLDNLVASHPEEIRKVRGLKRRIEVSREPS
ncbi:MAG: tetratricopeptide repeat protein [Thermodesulfobacteriota bacterium]